MAVYRPIRCKALSQEAMRGDAADAESRANADPSRDPAYARERFAALFASERASAFLMRA